MGLNPPMTKIILVMILLINLGRFHQRARFHTNDGGLWLGR